ncbi:MAG: ABC transporter permease subunit [Phycisphaeraceae bacterium]|nr:ABC transporter permease subunit [Phycisphaeraceae bacterium]
MSALWQRLWRLGPANPMVQRVVLAGSRRAGHHWVRTGYLGGLCLLVILTLLGSGQAGTTSLSELAKAGGWVFLVVSYGQVALICLLAPIFMAGAISQEQSNETFDILLTTPLSNLQIVLGTLFGRLYFILALLLSSLPLFAVILPIGGVPVRAVFVSLGVSAATALLVGSVAITLAVRRVGGRKTVFFFVVAVVAILALTYIADQVLRDLPFMQPTSWAAPADSAEAGSPTTPDPNAWGQGSTTWLTPLHPLLVLEAALGQPDYRVPAVEDLTGLPSPLARYAAHPLASFMLLCSLSSAVLLTYSAWRVRRPTPRSLWKSLSSALERTPTNGANGAIENTRPAQAVWHNAIAWREAHAQRQSLISRLGRWGFFALCLAAGAVLLLAYHHHALGALTAGASTDDAQTFHFLLLTLLLLEVAVVTLVALYVSAGAVSREREDGTLDLMLTTPVTPADYLWGKLRGLVSFLTVLMAGPVVTVALVSLYTAVGLALQWPTAKPRFDVAYTSSGSPTAVHFPLVPVEAAFLFLLLLTPFLALCIAIGMHWSLRSKGILSAVVHALVVVAVMTFLLAACGYNLATSLPIFGQFANALSPATNFLTILNPWEHVAGFADEPSFGRAMMIFSALFAATVYAAVVYTLMRDMTAKFDHTVRKLSGAN